jgi:lipid-A-disaccharide synthase-like uncharacterized protein
MKLLTDLGKHFFNLGVRKIVVWMTKGIIRIIMFSGAAVAQWLSDEK